MDNILKELQLVPQRKFEKKRNADIRQTSITLPKTTQAQDILFVKPQTYMNLSGSSIQPILHFYKLQPQQLLVIHDDLDLPFGEIKYKPKGSSGGQNGIKDIINKLGTQDFFRLKVGIGRPENKQHEVIDRVLSKLTTQELETLQKQTPSLITTLGLFAQGKC